VLIACLVAQSVVEDYKLEVVDAFPLPAFLFDSAAARSNEDVSTQGGPTAVFLASQQQYFVLVSAMWVPPSAPQSHGTSPSFSGTAGQGPVRNGDVVVESHPLPMPSMTAESPDAGAFEMVPWKLSGNPSRDRRQCNFEKKLRLHFAHGYRNANDWSLNLQASLFRVSRALVTRVKDNMYVQAFEMTAPNAEQPDRFDLRRVHFFRLTQRGSDVEEAVRFPGRGVCARGQWQHLVLDPRSHPHAA
jgi:hypothetical protein